jgi:hypothetical protein
LAIESVTVVELSFNTVRPPESSIVTTGCEVNAVPPVVLPGCVVKTSCVAWSYRIWLELVAVVVSELVDTVRPFAPLLVYVPAAGSVMPAMPIEAVVLLGRVQVPPLLESVIVTTRVLPTVVVAPTAEQFVKPTGSVIVGLAGTVNALGKATLIVRPGPVNAPVAALVLNPTVQVTSVALANTWDVVGVNVTAVTVVCAAIVTFPTGLPAVPSALVWTVKNGTAEVRIVPAAGLVMPSIVSCAAVVLPSAQPPPASVIATI